MGAAVAWRAREANSRATPFLGLPVEGGPGERSGRSRFPAAIGRRAGTAIQVGSEVPPFLGNHLQSASTPGEPAPGLGVTDEIEDRLEEVMGEAPLGNAGP